MALIICSINLSPLSRGDFFLAVVSVNALGDGSSAAVVDRYPFMNCRLFQRPEFYIMRGSGMGEGRQTERDRRVSTRNESVCVCVCVISTGRGTIILLYMIGYRGKSYARQKTDCV